jgi:hypothetical protein
VRPSKTVDLKLKLFDIMKVKNLMNHLLLPPIRMSPFDLYKTLVTEFPRYSDNRNLTIIDLDLVDAQTLFSLLYRYRIVGLLDMRNPQTGVVDRILIITSRIKSFN